MVVLRMNCSAGLSCSPAGCTGAAAPGRAIPPIAGFAPATPSVSEKHRSPFAPGRSITAVSPYCPAYCMLLPGIGIGRLMLSASLRGALSPATKSCARA